MNEWISCEKQRPTHGQKVKIKIVVELDAIAKETEDYYSWEIKLPEGMSTIGVPTHWMPLPESPEGKS
jgi:hypothetical protein